MDMPLDARTGAITRDVETLVRMAWAGKIRVPRFQRDFRWGWEDVKRLFDSILRGYPIGSLLLWERGAPKQELRLGELVIDAEADSNALWVVDGQQRITSLANALHPAPKTRDEFALSYNLENGEFVRTKPAQDPLTIPLPVLFDLKAVLKWFADNPMIAEKLDRASEITRGLRQFPIPAYQVSHDDPKMLQDIFDRMNNYGKRLSRAEIFTALTSEDDGVASEELTINAIAEHINSEFNFGLIDGNTVLQAVLARRGPDVKRGVRDEFGEEGDESRDTAFEQGEQALRRAVTFLQRDAGVPHFSMLAYRYLLPPLVRVFALFPEPTPQHRRLLRRWFWRAAVAGPQQFKAGTGDAARMLCARVREHDLTGSIEAMLELVARDEPTLPNLRGFATNQAATKIVLCSWWDAGPRNPEDGSRYEIPHLADALADRGTARDAVRYIVPSKSLPKPFQPWAANRVLMPELTVDAEEVLALLARRTKLPDGTWAEVLESHTLTEVTLGRLREGALAQALELRHELLVKRLRDFLMRMCEWGREDTPPLAELIIPDEADEDDDADQ